MKKGIVMATLVVMLSVIVILVSVISVTGINTYNTSRKLAFASELKMVQESVNSYKSDNNENLPISDFVVIDLSGASSDVLEQFVKNGEKISNNKVSLNKIDFNDLNVKSLTRGTNETDDDVYVVSTKTGIVYYAKGLKIGTNTYYTLTEELKKLLHYNVKTFEQKSSDSVVFEVSTKEWTKNNVDVKIKVPDTYEITEIKLSTSNTPVTISPNVNENYMEQTVTLNSNATISVKYKDNNDQDKKASYDVKNIDNAEPVVSVNNVTTVGNKKFVKITSVDNNSGIKTLKYEEGDMTQNIGIFGNSDKNIENNNFEVDIDTVKVTIYAEDNAGNYSATLIEL